VTPSWRRLLWPAVLSLVTALLIPVRAEIDQSSVAFVYLLIVLGASAQGGRLLPLLLGGVGFVLFDYYFQTPFDELSVAKPLDWLVLVSFLVTAVVASQLVGEAKDAAAAAERHAHEVERLSCEREQLAAEAANSRSLREADRLKDALLAAVSHDLRTPLTAIKALARDLAIAGEERGAVIEQQADRLNRVVGELLDLSRLNAGGMVLEPEVIAAEDLLGAALQQIEAAWRDRQVHAAVEWSEPPLCGRFDFVHAQRILVNLLDNAAKYSAPVEPIEVAVRRDGPWIAFAVSDRGRGVPPPERERIFQPFYRAPSASPDTGGFGLGLAISRRLAEAQAGTLEHADRSGGGSVFTLRLPAVDFVAS
jgi:two-component system sensor histidine kinase KdpD